MPSQTETNWPWLYKPKPAPLPPKPVFEKVQAAANQLLSNDESLTELDFTEQWEAKVMACMRFADGKEECRASDNTDGEGIEVDYAKRCIKLPDFVVGLLSIGTTVEGRDIRFACISPDCGQDGRIVMISYWADKERSINNIYLVMADIEQALLLVSAILRLVYEVNNKNLVRTHKFDIMLIGPINIQICTPAERDTLDQQKYDKRKRDEEAFMRLRLDSDGNVEEKTSSEDESEEEGVEKKPKAPKEPPKPQLVIPDKPVHFILDEESLGVYDNVYSTKPTHDFRFYKEVSDTSIESIYVCNLTGYLEVQQGNVVGIIQPSTVEYSECFRDFTMMLRERKIGPKSLEIFTDPELFEKYMEEQPPVEQAPALIQNQPRSEDNQGHLPAAGGSLAAGASQQEGTWLSNIITGDHLSTADEEMQIMWFAAEADLQTAIKDGKIPESRIESSGLDSNSQEHLLKVVESIRDQLFQNGYGAALSQLQGCRRVYGDTLLRDVKHVDDLDIMKRIFLLSS